MILFNSGDRLQNHTIFIRDDIECEQTPNEFFFSNITLSRGVRPIDVVTPQAIVTISDSDGRECSTLTQHTQHTHTHNTRTHAQHTQKHKHTHLSISAADIRVGYESTVHTTSEGNAVVELCAILYEPFIDGPSPRPFTLSYETSDGTASQSQTFTRKPLTYVTHNYCIFSQTLY